jgi:cell division protein FtsB
MNNIWNYIFKVSLGVVIVVSAIGLLSIFIPEYSRMTELQRKKGDLQAKNTGLESRIHDYQTRQNRFRTDPRFVERLVREQFGMVRENELIYKVIHDTPEAAPSPAPGKP